MQEKLPPAVCGDEAVCAVLAFEPKLPIPPLSDLALGPSGRRRRCQHIQLANKHGLGSRTHKILEVTWDTIAA